LYTIGDLIQRKTFQRIQVNSRCLKKFKISQTNSKCLKIFQVNSRYLKISTNNSKYLKDFALDPPIITLWMNIEKKFIHDDTENDVGNDTNDDSRHDVGDDIP
jgi:hypothetical protein